jgi:hypothetical protein
MSTLHAPPRTAYLAARYSRRKELAGYRDGDLARLGIHVPAVWLNGDHQLDDLGVPVSETGEVLFESDRAAAAHYRAQFATDDLGDVLSADILIAFTEEPRSTNSRGGRHVELGIALGAGKPVYIVGPRENVFCHLPVVCHFDTWAALVAYLESRFPANAVAAGSA